MPETLRTVNIARCPEHGLHGERTECFVCGRPVEQVPMVEKAPVEAERERLSSTVGELKRRLRSIQGDIRAPEAILWLCPGEGCTNYTFGPDWRCPLHVDDKPIPVRMVPVADAERERMLDLLERARDLIPIAAEVEPEAEEISAFLREHGRLESV